MGHWPKLYRLFPSLIVFSSGSIMFGLVGKYIGNKETKGCHKCWLKLWLKDRGGEALSYGGFSDCVIVSVTELLVHPVEWPPASGKHFSTCEESLIPGAEVGFAICVCGTRKSQPLGTGGSQLVTAPTQILGTLKLFKSLLVCSGHIFQSRTTIECSVHVQEKLWVMHGRTCYGSFCTAGREKMLI